MITIIVFCIAILICLLLYTLIQTIKFKSKYLKNLPGPKPIFPIGNAIDMSFEADAILDTINFHLNKNGDTIVIQIGWLQWGVITIDNEFIELILCNSSDSIDKPEHYDYFKGWLGECIFTSLGSKWRSQRKAMSPSFHFSLLQQYVSVFESNGDKLVKKFREEMIGKDSIEISEILALYSLDVICETALGVTINALNQENCEYIKSLKTVCHIVLERTLSFLNPIMYPLTLNYYREKAALKVLHKFAEEIVTKKLEKHKKSDSCGEKKRLPFLDSLLESGIDGKPLSKDELRDQANTIIFGGHDTIASAAAFCMLMLATHPDVQEKVFKEQADFFGSNLKTASPTYQDLNEFKYLKLVIKETLRLYPSAPFFGRKLAKELEFKGTLYPKGQHIMILPYLVQRNPVYFPEPDQFIPERFENPTTIPPFAYIPFSAGSRNCLGQKFAMLEMLSAMSKIVRNFVLAPAKPEHKIKLVGEIVLVSKNGVQLSLQNRE